MDNHILSDPPPPTHTHMTDQHAAIGSQPSLSIAIPAIQKRPPSPGNPSARVLKARANPDDLPVASVEARQPSGPVSGHLVGGAAEVPRHAHRRSHVVEVIGEDLEHLAGGWLFREADGDGVHGHSTHDGAPFTC